MGVRLAEVRKEISTLFLGEVGLREELNLRRMKRIVLFGDSTINQMVQTDEEEAGEHPTTI